MTASPRIVAFLPHVGLYGGNLRYLEIGNRLVFRGIDFTIATPTGERPAYFEFAGRTATHEEAFAHPPDILLASEQRLFDAFRAVKSAKHFYYFVIEGAAREAQIAKSGVRLLANSSGLTARLANRYGVRAEPIIGGVNPHLFRPLDPAERERRAPESFRVVANGRFARPRKGTRLVARALDGLARRRRGIELVLFDSSTVDHVAGIPENFSCCARVRLDLDVPRASLRLVYGSADLFISAEKRAGWSNPTLEAMACGVPVICTSSGTTDFAAHEKTALVCRRDATSLRHAIERLMRDVALRERLAAAGLARARELTWDRTVDALLATILD